MTRLLFTMHTPFQVNFFEQVMDKAGNDYEYLFAARDRDSTVPMLIEKGLRYENLGGYSGSELKGKLDEYANAIIKLGDIIDDFKPDLILTERYPAGVRAAHLKGIPCWTIFNDEREFHVNHLTHPLASKIFVPSFYDESILVKQGVTDMSKVIRFYGFITCYMKDLPKPDYNPLLDVPDVDPDLPIILVRPEFEFSVFFKGYKPLLESIVPILVKNLEANIIVMPRTESQAERFGRSGAIVTKGAFRENPIACADLALGAAESMLCEAFTMGTPAISCIYWELTEPMKLLHKYIPQSTDPKHVLKLARDLIQDDQKIAQYKSMSQEVIGGMQNPVDVMVDQIALEFG